MKATTLQSYRAIVALFTTRKVERCWVKTEKGGRLNIICENRLRWRNAVRAITNGHYGVLLFFDYSLKTSEFEPWVGHQIGIESNNGNGVELGVKHYSVRASGHLENNGTPAPDLQYILLDLHSDGAHQPYTPWSTPDLTKFTDKELSVGANGYWFAANVTSIVNEADQPFTVWPGDGNMHISQQFDVFVTAPEGCYNIELLTDPIAPQLPVFCEIAPNFNGQTEIKFLCRDLNASILDLYFANNKGVIIRLNNPDTGKTIERVMNWRKID